jgi:GR25 family glycosyltransferase involved in LPS biosynthesis
LNPLRALSGLISRRAEKPAASKRRAPVILINLERDRDRLDRMTLELAGQDIALTRLDAVLGTTVPRAMIDALPGASALRPGTLGCFLSHMRAWEMVAASADTEGAVILEDDVNVLRDLAECHAMAVGTGKDVVFLNHRMAPPQRSNAAASEVLSIVDAVLARTGRKGSACGTDAYFLSRHGARTLLQLVQQQGARLDVDWLVLYATIGAMGLPAIASNETFARILGLAASLYDIATPLISGAALARPAVRHGAIVSTRLELNAG